MPTDFGFRFSTYMALALAVVSLGYAEWDLLPSVSYFSAFVLGMLVYTFRRDGRNELTLAMANRVGLVIGIVMAAYLAMKFFLPSTSLIDQLPFPASLLPYLGPVLMVLIPAKLLRPKHEGDWWALHGIGLSVVGLACSMCEDSFIFILVAIYALAGVWSLMLFYFRRGAGAIAPVPNWKRAEEPLPRTAVAPHSPPKSKFGGIRLRRPIVYLALVGGIGFMVFLFTPRSEGPRWSLTFQREVGFSTDDQAPDLTKPGDLKDNKDRAFEVHVRDAEGNPKNDLDPNQRWRGAAYISYQNGKWLARGGLGRYLLANGVATPQTATTPPPVPPDGWSIDFFLNGKRRDPVLSDPTWWSANFPPPVTTLIRDQNWSWFQSGDGGFIQPTARSKVQNYRQVTKAPVEMDLGPPFQLVRGAMFSPGSKPGLFRGAQIELPKTEDEQYLNNLEPLRFQSLVKVKDWTDSLLVRLTKEGKLPAGILERRDPDTGFVALNDFEKVARAIGMYFASSGEFNYGSKNERVDKNLDPVEDFLLNTKTGSCEWYATALTLCLRSAGLPAQCVLGFKGFELEEDGRYTVRQDHAHAWVEVLIPRPLSPGAVIVNELDFERNSLPAPTRQWHWLTIDPTPGSGADDTPVTGLSGIWDHVKTRWRMIYNDFVVRYDPERRERISYATGKWLNTNWKGMVALFFIAASTACGYLLFRRIRKQPVVFRITELSTIPAWYHQSLLIAERAGYVPQLGETPKDFAMRLATTATNAGPIFQRITDEFYAIRYAGVAPIDLAGLNNEVGLLATALPSPL